MQIWKKVKVASIEYTIAFSNEQECPHLHDCEGVTMPEKALILIREDIPAVRFEDTVVHELIHAIFEACGISTWLMGVTNTRGKAFYRTEEMLVRLLTPNILETLRNLDVIKPFKPAKETRNKKK